MVYVLFGSPIFTRLVLEQLMEAGILPKAVVCNPDRPAGRHQVMTPPEVKRYILEKNLPIEILQPEDPSSVAGHLVSLSPDFFVVAAYAKILKNDILSVPRLGTIGIHSSLLPKYRGTSPIQNAMMAGEKETGATLYLMDEKMDHGPILSRVVVPIADDDTHDTLMRRIWSGGGRELVSLIPSLLAGTAPREVQDETRATYTKKLKTEDGYVEPVDLASAILGDAEKAILIDRKIRSLNPEPGVWTLQRHATCDTGIGKTSDMESGDKRHRPGRASEMESGDMGIGKTSGKEFSDPPNGETSMRQEQKEKRMKLLAAEINDGCLVLKIIQIEGEKPKKVG